MHAFDIPCLEQGGFEADDLIATYVRQACEAGATATIVASDKDLMQLVNDCVVMYDTMKDKRIGIPEVIEKFGVPPAKVIEVQALIGDSTDNVPGVPGIGVKTAAQLIGEYGDLETLLARAGEIKQEKRRQSLIDNAEQARLSKQLVTLDDHVKLDVPLADLAVHEPDYKRLIAFLKAMEFATLTRRVAEFSGVEAAEIEADGKLEGAAPAESRAAEPELDPRARGDTPKPRQARSRARTRVTRPSRPAERRRPARVHAAGALRHARIERGAQRQGRPLALRDRAHARPAQRLDRARARARPRSRSIRRPPASTRCRRRCAASRSRSRRTKPATCRSPIARAETAATAACSPASVAPDQIPERAALAALKPLLEDQGVLKIGHEHQVRPADVRAARHRDRALRRHHADVLRARCRPLGHGARRAGAALSSITRPSTYNELTGSGKSKLTFDCVDVEQGRRIRRRARRHHAAAVACAQAAPGRRAREQRL